MGQPRRSVFSPHPTPVHDHYLIGSIFAIAFLIWGLGSFEDPHKRLAVFIFSFFIAIFLANIATGLFAWLLPGLLW